MGGGEGQSVLNAWMSGEEQNWGWGGGSGREKADGWIAVGKQEALGQRPLNNRSFFYLSKSQV